MEFLLPGKKELKKNRVKKALFLSNPILFKKYVEIASNELKLMNG